MSQQNARIDPSLVVAIAKKIGNCDFRATVQAYVTGMTRPWIITVGETKWQRHLVVEQISSDGINATLAILGPDQSDKFGYNIDTCDIAVRIELVDLVKGGYVSVKNFLQPKALAA